MIPMTEGTNSNRYDHFWSDELPGTSDEELMKACISLTKSMKLIGCGPEGCSIVDECGKRTLTGVEPFALGSDVHQLEHICSPHKLLLTKRTVRRMQDFPLTFLQWGFDGDDHKRLRDVLCGTDIVVVSGSIGDGIGTYLIPAVSRIAKETGVLTIAYVTYPGSWEGETRMGEAELALKYLRDDADCTFIVRKDKCAKYFPRLPPYSLFKVALEGLFELLKGMMELSTKVGIINLNLAEMAVLLRSGTVGYVGVGRSDSNERWPEAVTEAMSSCLFDMDPSKVTGGLVKIVGGEDMTVDEAQAAFKVITDGLNPRAHVLWGAFVEPSLEKTIEIMAVMTQN